MLIDDLIDSDHARLVSAIEVKGRKMLERSAAVFLILSTAATGQEIQDGSAINVSDERKAELFARLRDALRDPTSAQITNLSSNGNITCGKVNSKNGFGGYVGYQEFRMDAAGSGIEWGGYKVPTPDYSKTVDVKAYMKEVDAIAADYKKSCGYPGKK